MRRRRQRPPGQPAGGGGSSGDSWERVRSSACGELRTHELVHDARVRLPLRLAYDLADEEAEEALLAVAVRGDLAGVGLQDRLDDRLELGRFGDGFLREVGVGGEAWLREFRNRLVEGRARYSLAGLDELRELPRRGGCGIDARAHEVVRDDVRGGDGVGSRGDGLLPQPVEPAGHENGR